MPPHPRKCHDCGNVAEHACNVVPAVLCKLCGSQDTRLVRPVKERTVLTNKTLIEAGFKEFSAGTIDRYDALFQKRIRDLNGTRYFINVTRWDHPDHTGWQVEVTYNDGCAFHPQAPVEVKAFGSVANWTPAQVEFFAQQLWSRLNPNYYEREN